MGGSGRPWGIELAGLGRIPSRLTMLERRGCAWGRFMAKAFQQQSISVGSCTAMQLEPISNDMRSKKSRFASVKFGWPPECCHAGARSHSRLVALAACAIL